jgi:hypothetical protein
MFNQDVKCYYEVISFGGGGGGGASLNKGAEHLPER